MAWSRELAPKTVNKDKKDYQYQGKRSKKLNEVKLEENISKNLQSFLEISPVQKEVLPSYKLQQNPCE